MTAVTSVPAVPPYEGLAAHYDELFGEQPVQDRVTMFEWVVDRYGLRFTSAVDVGCGTGTFVDYLLRSGVQPVWGVDLSPAMLARAIAKNPQNEGRFLLQDIRELRLPASVDLLICQFETLNYLLTDADLRTALSRFAGALAPGGYAVFDVATRRPGQPESEDGMQDSQFATHSVTIRARYDTASLLQVASVSVVGATAPETHVQRIHTVDEVVAALDGSGLALRAMHDSTDVLRPARQAENVTFLAQRTLPAAGMPGAPST